MVTSVRSPGLQAIFKSGTLLRYYKGATVANTGDGDVIMYAESGYIKRQMISNDGNFYVQIIYGPQDIFSLTRIYQLLLNQEIYDGQEVYYYQALTEAHLYSLDRRSLIKAVESDPVIYKELFSEAGQHLRASVKSLENLGLGTVIARVAHQLAYLAKRFGQPLDDGSIEIQIPLTHHDLASLLSVARESVSRALIRLRMRDLVIDKNQQFIIKNIEELTALAHKYR